MTITVLLADDHVLFRQGLALLVGRQPGWEVVGESGDGEEAVQLARRYQPHVAVLDVEMPRLDGIEAACDIKEVSPATRIVALSMYADAHYQERMFAAGASAYVLKNEAIDDLVTAIGAALRGERFVSPAAGRVPVPEAFSRRSAELDKRRLSEQEIKVLRLLAQGWRMNRIAEALGISPRTVETYRKRIMVKLDIDTLPGLVKFAVRAGIASARS